MYFALRQCFTCYVSSRGNAGAHKFLWAALYFFSLRNPAIFGLFLLHELELVSSLEKETGTFLIVTCNKKKKKIVIPSYQLIKTANVICGVKIVLTTFSYCKRPARLRI